MKFKTPLLLALTIYSSLSHSEPVLDRVYLYLPDSAMKERIKNQEHFISYISQVRDQLMIDLRSLKNEPKSSLGVIVTIRPGNESKVWYQQLSGSIDQSILASITNAIETINAPEVTTGIVPFSFALRLGGSTEKFESPPVDGGWFNNQDTAIEITELIGKVWQ